MEGGFSRERLLGRGVLTVVLGFDLCRGEVAQRGVQAGVVEVSFQSVITTLAWGSDQNMLMLRHSSRTLLLNDSM